MKVSGGVVCLKSSRDKKWQFFDRQFQMSVKILILSLNLAKWEPVFQPHNYAALFFFDFFFQELVVDRHDDRRRCHESLPCALAVPSLHS